MAAGAPSYAPTDRDWYTVAVFAIVLGRQTATACRAASHLVSAADHGAEAVWDDALWTSMSAFLSSAATVGRFLWYAPNPRYRRKGRTDRLDDQAARWVRDKVRELLGPVPHLESLRTQAARDSFEHVDERVEAAIVRHGVRKFFDGVLTTSAGESSSGIATAREATTLRGLEIDTRVLVISGDEYPLEPMMTALEAIRVRTDAVNREALRHVRSTALLRARG